MKPLWVGLLSLLLSGAVWLGGPPLMDAAEKEPTFEGKSLSAWVEALKDKDPKIRVQAAKALESIGPKAKAAVPALIDALKDESVLVRGPAAGALGGIGPEAKAAVPALVETLKDKNEHLRCQAALALGKIGPDARAAV